MGWVGGYVWAVVVRVGGGVVLRGVRCVWVWWLGGYVLRVWVVKRRAWWCGCVTWWVDSGARWVRSTLRGYVGGWRGVCGCGGWGVYGWVNECRIRAGMVG